MKAIALTQYLPISHPDALQAVELPMPTAQGRDLLVQIEAIAVNPVDAKVRSQSAPAESTPRVLGWDAVGTVVATGPDASLFKVGDAVYYAGSITRPGANSEYHLVDERIVGRKPASLTAQQAAAIPLTAITAYEALFDRLGVSRQGGDAGKTVLIIGGAGGVGSMAIQLAKLAGLKVVATASRPGSSQWCKDLGADHVIDHNGDMVAQLKRQGVPAVHYILCANDTNQHFNAMADIIAPQGAICSIVGVTAPIPMEKLFGKSVRFVWEMMFTRAMFQTPDMIRQHELLNEVSALIDAGTVRTTLGEVFGTINVANLRRAHAAIESGHTVGKIVLSGF